MKTFERLGNRSTFIGPSPVGHGAYDLTQLLGPSAPVIHGDELWFYYTGIKYRTRPENVEQNAGAVCLAVLRRDGFVSLDAGETDGMLVTKPFRLAATDFFVNVDATNGGSLQILLLDKLGQPMAVSGPITGDSCRAPVLWERGDLSNLLGQTVQVQFRLRKAQLYSFWFDK